MLQTLKHSLALCFLFFCATSNAETITHNFHSKSTLPDITLETVDETHVRSTNDGIVYTLSGAKTAFGYDVNHKDGTGAVITLNLFSQYGYVTVSPAFSRLSGITISHIVETGKTNNLSSKLFVYLSTDSLNWASVTPTVVYGTGSVEVTPPAPGNYYVKIYNDSKWEISITRIVYTTSSSDCNCFIYTPE
jgi:hypothetical protein